jgi:hypothetical protein
MNKKPLPPRYVKPTSSSPPTNAGNTLLERIKSLN